MNEGEMALLHAHARVGIRLHAVVRLGVAAMAAVLARTVLLRRVVVRRRVAVLLRRSRVPGHRGGREHEHGKRQRHQQPLQQSRHGWMVPGGVDLWIDEAFGRMCTIVQFLILVIIGRQLEFYPIWQNRQRPKM
uniref:Uncharacterized protein n=1 Tax=Oryza meridionalis TaxID=40149 RepID=A0A0E0DX31_9ORYZ